MELLQARVSALDAATLDQVEARLQVHDKFCFYIYATHEAANWDACLICSFTDFGKKSPPLFRVSSGR